MQLHFYNYHLKDESAHVSLTTKTQEVPIIIARKGRAASKAATEKIANNVKVKEGD